MKNIKLNIFKKFNEHIRAAVILDGKNVLNRNLRNQLFFITFLALYVMSKPFYIYYIGYLKEQQKIKNLKKEGRFILDI